MSDRPGITDSIAARQNSATAVCEVFGFPREDWPMFARWAAGPMTPLDEETLFQYVDLKIAERCWKPTDDLLSQLIDVEVDGVELTTDEIHRFVASLIGATVF
ncbi:hypothetical protein H7J88_03445 [Mycolicibacterium flavescens]|uniref:Cytochrome P450 n=1 Tax=Mycolicibacterium flavescens TaxID=1776 RepID=A0A1E3RBR3_MYCFV|nr:hypothetical protein [Mycolicibacterium flavescens]MCV7278699.1 hypothetical protein [Mycolicibacterium flavescens]ODQ87259.1 hypothetical protein BHQ18_24075 [Mycolicibacterium flavescens]